MAPPSPEAPPEIPTTDRLAVWVLAQMLRSTDVRAKRKALARIDPLSRTAVAHRVESALDDARFDAPETDETHFVRIASLELMHRVPENPRDMAAVEAAYAELPRPPDRAPLWTRTLVLVATVFALGLGALLYRALAPKPYAALYGSGPESASAFRSGGRPRHDPLVREALARDLPALSVAASRFIMDGVPYDPELRRLNAKLTDAELVRALGPFPADALRRLVDSYSAYVRGDAEEPAVRAAVKRFDDALVTAGLGYRVEIFPLRSTVLALSTHSVETVRIRRVGARSMRLITIDRLDRLNLRIPLLGYVPRGEDLIAIPIDQADRLLTSVLLPLLETPPALTLMDPQIRLARYPWMTSTHAAAKTVVSRSLVEGHCGAELMHVVALLEERSELFGRWSELLARDGIVLEKPDRYQVDIESLERRAGGRLPRFAELERIDDALGSEAASRAFACARDRVVDAFATGVLADVAEHADANEFRDPALVALIDPAQQMSPESFREDPIVHAIRGRFITLASAGRDGGLPLTMMLRCYTNGGVCDRESEVATVFVFAELARELRLRSFREPALVNAATVGAIFQELAQKNPAEVASAAGRAFARVFGRPVTALR